MRCPSAWRGGAAAEIDVPVSDGGSVHASGGARYLRTAGGYAIYAAGSGQHHFTSMP